MHYFLVHVWFKEEKPSNYGFLRGLKKGTFSSQIFRFRFLPKFQFPRTINLEFGRPPVIEEPNDRLFPLQFWKVEVPVKSLKPNTHGEFTHKTLWNSIASRLSHANIHFSRNYLHNPLLWNSQFCRYINLGVKNKRALLSFSSNKVPRKTRMQS